MPESVFLPAPEIYGTLFVSSTFYSTNLSANLPDAVEEVRPWCNPVFFHSVFLHIRNKSSLFREPFFIWVELFSISTFRISNFDCWGRICVYHFLPSRSCLIPCHPAFLTVDNVFAYSLCSSSSLFFCPYPASFLPLSTSVLRVSDCSISAMPGTERKSKPTYSF